MNDGVSFENTVERWLRRRGARTAERRAHVRGKIAQRTHEVDVHATVVSEMWKPSAAFALTSLVAMFAGGVIGVGIVCAIGMLMLAGSTVMIFVFLTDPKHVWVECKSGEATITRAVVWKLVGQVDDVREWPHAKWFPHEAWIVSRAPFDVDALAVARDHGVRCFQEQRGQIHEVV